MIRSEYANESTQIYNEKIYFLNAQSSPTQICYFFSTQPFTYYFTSQRYIALIKPSKIAENRVVIFFGYLQHFHQMPLLLEDLAWLFLDYCVF